MSQKILIIEDAVFVREMEKKILLQNGFEVIGETSSETEGIAIYQKGSPDLVIVDLQLAEGTGIGAMAQIAKINPNARFIVITSHTDMLDELNDGAKQQILGVLNKPFAADELIEIAQKSKV